jgi:hypothetical protein
VGESRSGVDVAAGSAPATDRGRAISLVAAEAGSIRGNHTTGLGDHRFDHLGRRRRLGNERRHPPQRRLLLREPGELLAALGIRDCGRDELSELRQALFCVGGQGLVAPRDGGQYTPEAALDGDRHPHGRAPAHLAGGGRGCAGRVCVAVYPRRLAGLEDQTGHGPLEGESRSGVDIAAASGPATERGNRAVGLVAGESGALGGKQLGDLDAHRLEHLGRWRSAGNERRHPPERRLLLRQPPQLTAILGAWVLWPAGRAHRVTVPHKRSCATSRTRVVLADVV